MTKILADLVPLLSKQIHFRTNHGVFTASVLICIVNYDNLQFRLDNDDVDSAVRNTAP